MDVNKQSQQAGEGSQLVQAGTIVINQGVSEERVRTVFNEMVPRALEEYTKEAYAKANERITNWENSVLPRVNEVKGMLEAFADPAFQQVLRKAQQSAAATDEKADYDLLTELLVCHVEKGDSRKNYVGINKAVEIVGQIDNDALCGLTVAHVLERFAPITGDVTHGLEVLEEVYRKLVYQDLPKGEDWLDHLDTLGAIRMSSVGGFNKFVDYYPKVLNGYACIGIKKESKEYHKASELLQKISLNAETCLKPNEFLDGFVRIDIRSFDQIETLWVIHQGIGKPITSKEKQVFEAVWKLYETDANKQKQVNEAFVKKWDSYPVLKEIHGWWDEIPTSFSITKVGEILAHTNAKRCDSTIPDMI